VQLQSLYRMRFGYPEEWGVDLAEQGAESRFFFIAEGRCEGRIAGRLRAANFPRRRGDGTFQPDFHGVIETDDGATLMLDLYGYGRAYPVGRRQIVAFAIHVTDAPAYGWLNDVVCAVAGEVRAGAGDDETVLVADVAELVWEPPDDGPPS
jgi:hypothetical protein